MIADRAAPADSTPLVDKDNPWPGLFSFTEADREFFKGRNGEIEDLLSLVNRQTLAVLYGKSGLGKTSLLRAGLFPRLIAEDIFPIYIRLAFERDSPHPVEQVFERIRSSKNLDAPSVEVGETLWEYFHRRDADFWDVRNRLVTPLLVFDQFEEIFTKGARNGRLDDSLQFLVQLSDLVEGRVPREVEDEVHELLGKTDIRRAPFTFDRHYYKVVLSLREDFLPRLDDLRGRYDFPSLASPRLRLREMNGSSAYEVVAHADHLVDGHVAEEIVRFVAAERSDSQREQLRDLDIEPALLSVICSELNTRRIAEGRRKITLSLLEVGQEEILSNFYERALEGEPQAVRDFIEENLLDVSGERNSVAKVNALDMEAVDEAVIERLVKRRLIRIDDVSGRERVELTHDLLAPVVASSLERATREKRRRATEARLREAERRANKARRRALLFLVLFSIAIVSVGAVGWALLVVQQTSRELRIERDRSDAAAEQARAAEAVARAAEADARIAQAQAERATEEAVRQARRASRLQASAEQAEASTRSALAETERLRGVASERAEREVAARQEAESQRALARKAEVSAQARATEAEEQRREAERLRRLSQAEELAARSTQVRGNETLAVALALEAFHLDRVHRREDDPHTNVFLHALRVTVQALRARPSVFVIDQSTPARSLAFMGGLMFVGDEAGRLHRYDLSKEGSRAVVISREPGPIRALASGDGRIFGSTGDGRIASWSGDGRRQNPEAVLNLSGERRRSGLEGREQRWHWWLSGLDYSDGRLFAGYSSASIHSPTVQAAVGLYSTSGVRAWSERVQDVNDVAMASRGGLFAAATSQGAAVFEGRAALLQRASLRTKLLCVDDGTDTHVRSVAFSPDGSHLACGMYSGTIRIADLALDTASNEPPFSSLVSGTRSPVTAVSFHPSEDAHLLASGGLDGTVRLWDLREQPVRSIELSGHEGFIWDVQYLPSGEELASAGADGSVRLWPVRAAYLAEEACRLLDRGLTMKEWADYLPDDLACRGRCPDKPACQESP